MKLMDYQAKRGGRVVFQDIAKPSSTEWGSPLDAMEAALELEKTVKAALNPWLEFILCLFTGKPESVGSS